MGKPTGFLEYPRELPLVHAPAERIHDWEEFHGHPDKALLQKQGARCMDCGVPFCHTGIVIEGCRQRLPDQQPDPRVERPGLSRLVAGSPRTGCTRPITSPSSPAGSARLPVRGRACWGSANPRSRSRPSNAAIIDKAFEEGWVTPQPPAQRTGKKVAVVGSGPAGLACAAQLNKAGHLVTVFERADRIGGLLMYGIPNMKLDKRIVQRRVDLLQAEGVAFVTCCEVGKDYPVEKLRSDFDAIVLCGGATKPNDFFGRTEGRHLHGIHFAMEFLHANTKSLLDSNHQDGNYLSARGKDVVVIGGGDTGTDCVGTALRHGCKSILQLEIVPMPPLSRAPDNPWPQWPKVYKLDYGQEEAKALFGDDPRKYSIQTTRFVGDAFGQRQGDPHVPGGVGQRQRPADAAQHPRDGTGLAGPASPVCPGLQRTGEPAAGSAWAWRRTSAPTPRRSMARLPPAFRASSRPATCAAGKAWSSGPSTRGEGPPASAIGS